MNSDNDLNKILINTNDINNYIEQNRELLNTPSFIDLLNFFLNRTELNRASIARGTFLNERYVYEIFDGKKKPSRDKILQLCIAMKLNLSDSNNLITSAGFNPLSARDIRDSIIIFTLVNKKNLIQCNELLLDQNQIIFK